MSIFEVRENVIPYEYPELMEYVKAIHASFWQVEKFPYERDIKDFKVNLSADEQVILMRSMLAIATVENKVKSFWADIYKRMPKLEIASVGYTFAGNETVHQLCYQRLLEVLNLDEEFETITQIPCMEGRIKYLNKYLEGVRSRSNKEFTKSLILFTLLVENCSLFSQFLIVASFYKYKDLLKNFSDIISATVADERLHAKFGSHLIKIIRKENPDWFDEEMENKIRRNIRKAYKAEIEVLDWIFEHSELDFISKNEVIEFLKTRFNDSLINIDYSEEFEVNEELLKKSNFLILKSKTTSDIDFFNGISSDYNKDRSFEEDALWD